MESLEERIRRVVQENVALVSYDPKWPRLFQEEKEHLLACLPRELIGQIEHFGSTAVPGLAAKPIIDILVEVRIFGGDQAEDSSHLGSAGLRLLLEADLG